MIDMEVIPEQERLRELKKELESELNADFIDWKNYYKLKDEIREIENLNVKI